MLKFHDQELKEVYPSQFIPLLEKSGLIILVGKWVIEQSSIMYQKLKQCRPDLKIQINLSYVRVLKSDVLSEMIAIIKKIIYLLDVLM